MYLWYYRFQILYRNNTPLCTTLYRTKVTRSEQIDTNFKRSPVRHVAAARRRYVPCIKSLERREREFILYFNVYRTLETRVTARDVDAILFCNL